MAGLFDTSDGGGNLSMLGLLAGLGIMNGASRGQSTGQAVSGGLLGALGGYGQMQQQQAITDLRNVQVAAAKQKLAQEVAWQKLFGGMAPGAPGAAPAAPAQVADASGALPPGAVPPPVAPTTGPLGGDALSRLPPGTLPIIGAMGREEGTKTLGQFLLKQAETGQFDPPETIQLPNGDGKMVPVLVQKNRLTGRYQPVDPATTRVNVAPQINVPVNTGNTVSTKLAEGIAGNMAEANKTASTAANSLIPQLYEARAALDQGKGIISGTGADWRLGLARALNTTGATDDERVANTEAYMRSTAGMVAGLVKQVGGTQISDSDRKFATAMAGGDVALSEPGLRRILDIGERAARASIRANNENARRFAAAQPAAAKQLGDLLTVTEPGPYQPKTAPPNPAAAPVAAPATAPVAAAPALKAPPTDADIRATATKYGIAPDEVRRRLGLPILGNQAGTSIPIR